MDGVYIMEYESIEEIMNEAIRLLDMEKYAECKKYLKKAKERFKKANTDEELRYLKTLEDNLK